MRTTKLLLFSAACVCLLFLFVGVVILGQIPSDAEIRGCMVTKMYHVNLCPTSGEYVKYKQISPYLTKTVVMTEDSLFWQHNGFDFSEMQKSLEANLKKGSYARGGSTITQQLAKNLFLTMQKTLARKGFEALITIRLEKVLTKKEILEKYLNVVQFGKDLFGIKAAAQFYFKKTPAQLDVVESAWFAFLLPSPEKYSKSYFAHQMTPFARARLTQIVNRLYEYHEINEGDYEIAKEKLRTFLGSAPPAQDLDYGTGEDLDKAIDQLLDQAPEESGPEEPTDVPVPAEPGTDSN